MTITLGSIPASTTIYIPFATYGNSDPASITMTGLAVTDIEIYKNGSTTQRASDNGYTLLDTDGIDFDGITGIHGFSVDLSDNSDSGFYAAGSTYWVVVSSITVDSKTINFIAATFRIVAAESVTGKPKVDVDAFGGTAGTFSSGRPEVNTTHLAGTAYGSADFSSTMKASINTEADTAISDYGPLKPTTAGRTLDVTATGAAGIDWGNIENTSSVVDLGLTTVGVVSLVDVVNDATVSSIGVNVITASALATDAVTEIATAVWALATRTLTANTNLSIPTAADIRSAVGLASANLDTQLGDLPTNAELTTALGTADDAVLAAIAALNNLSSAGAAAAVTTALTTVLTEGYRSTGATGSVRDLLYEIIAHMGESAIVGTTKTVKKLDGSTTAKTYTLNSATTPTSITETT